ncbi:hypothetical protein [Micromonospora sp. URMC 103]|uniref:hypothetical protein n=1 Tax=Micromonospora sp. URMC 103 TaxID=3423406 RepID=UPI003F1CF492
MAESVASDLAIARLIQRLGGSKRRSALDERAHDTSERRTDTPARPDDSDEPKPA